MVNRGALTLALMTSAAMPLAGCTIAWQGNFSYTHGAGNSCAITMDWCIFELPEIGYLGIKADGGVGLEYTYVAVRLAPRPGVPATWSAREVRVIDLDSKAVQEKAARTPHPSAGIRLRLRLGRPSSFTGPIRTPIFPCVHASSASSCSFPTCVQATRASQSRPCRSSTGRASRCRCHGSWQDIDWRVTAGP